MKLESDFTLLIPGRISLAGTGLDDSTVERLKCYAYCHIKLDKFR
jgi:hypothetical protein